MLIYFVVYLTSIAFAFSYSRSTRSENYGLYIFSFFLVYIFLFAFRSSSVGADTAGYIREYLVYYADSPKTEPLYRLFNAILRRMYLPPELFLMTEACLICYFTGALFSKHNNFLDHSFSFNRSNVKTFDDFIIKKVHLFNETFILYNEYLFPTTHPPYGVAQIGRAHV